MKRVLLALWLACAPLTALAQDGVVNPQTDQSQLTRNRGQLPGTATNDIASAGNVGQILTNTTSGVSVSSVTGKTITSQSLTAGDWDVWCTFNFTPAAGTTVTSVLGEVSPTDNTVPSTLGNYFRHTFEAASAAGAINIAFPTPQVPLSLSASTTYYCVAFAQFGVSTMTADAKLVARRRR